MVDPQRRARRRALLRTGAASLIGIGIAGIPFLAATARAQARKGASSGTVLILGDSLSAEYGLRRGSGWVEMLAQRLRSQQPARNVVNASVSGETTAGGRTRLAQLLETHRPSLVVIELGGNDGLRGLDLGATEANLVQMVRQVSASGARALLVGMRLPPNYGRAYGERFAALFEKVARSEKAALVPFLLAGVGERPELFQPDRIHPNEQAQAAMLENVWPTLKRLL